MSTSTATPPSYLIIGSGAFGASTALHLIRSHPNASITLLDRDHFAAPTRVAASWDWNKVVRADYSSLAYTKLALEAQELWRRDPLFKPFYHESGVVWISGKGFVGNVVGNHAALGVKADIEVCGVERARDMYGGLFEGADYTGMEEVLVNRGSGWAEAKEALQRTIEEAVRVGVRYVVAEVEALRFEDVEGGGSRCCGVVTTDGRRVDADRVVLCTGAYTPKLLVDSAPDWKELHAEGRILALGVTEGTAPWGEGGRGPLEAMPVGINDNPVERGENVGCLPLPSLSAVKCWGQIIFRNTVVHPVTKDSLSTSPTQRDYAQWDVPSLLQEDVHWALRSLLGDQKANLMKTENHRICWDAWTPTEDFIISPHTACQGLYVATCGSFHGFKFLPVIGKYVVEMLEGELETGLQEMWAWDRERPPMESEDGWARRELREFAMPEGRADAVPKSVTENVVR